MLAIEKENKDIKEMYKDLKRTKIKYLRYEWTRVNIIGDPQSLDKESLISDLLRSEFGNKKVDRAFNLS